MPFALCKAQSFFYSRSKILLTDLHVIKISFAPGANYEKYEYVFRFSGVDRHLRDVVRDELPEIGWPGNVRLYDLDYGGSEEMYSRIIEGN